MDFDDPLEVAGQLAEAAMASMARLGVAPTPTNFLIWYGHCSGGYPELSEQLFNLESSGAPFPTGVGTELYERFFGPTTQVRQINDACERIEATMARLLEEVDGLSAGAGAYGGKLRGFSDDLKSVDGKQALRGLVMQILGETKKMLTRAQHLERELNQSVEEMTSLRVNLASARREANTDDLTCVANRRCFNHELQRAAEQARIKREPLSVLMADVDHFKAFNDCHGHQVSDQVLKLVAQFLTKCVQGRDLAARYGGEEFAVILPQTGLEGARILAEQICNTLGAKPAQAVPPSTGSAKGTSGGICM